MKLSAQKDDYVLAKLADQTADMVFLLNPRILRKSRKCEQRNTTTLGRKDAAKLGIFERTGFVND